MSARAFELRVGDTLTLLNGVDTESVDGVVTDCPYSSGGTVAKRPRGDSASKYIRAESRNVMLGGFDGDSRDQRSWAYWCALWYSELLRTAKPGALCFSFTDWRQLPSTTDALQAGGWVWRGIVPWDKTASARPALGRPRTQCEYIVWGTKGEHKPWEGAPTIAGFYRARHPANREHPTQKPLNVIMKLVSIIPPGGLVIDPFCGSGTTGVAAIRTGRRALLFESNKAIAKQAGVWLEAEAQAWKRAG